MVYKSSIGEKFPEFNFLKSTVFSEILNNDLCMINI